MRPSLHLGARFTTTAHDLGKFHLPAHDLLTHAVIVGMTGSGKTGLVTVMVEEALRNRVPVLVIDVKGENYAVTARARRELDQVVHVVDPFSVTDAAVLVV